MLLLLLRYSGTLFKVIVGPTAKSRETSPTIFIIQMYIYAYFYFMGTDPGRYVLFLCFALGFFVVYLFLKIIIDISKYIKASLCKNLSTYMALWGLGIKCRPM